MTQTRVQTNGNEMLLHVILGVRGAGNVTVRLHVFIIHVHHLYFLLLPDYLYHHGGISKYSELNGFVLNSVRDI